MEDWKATGGAETCRGGQRSERPTWWGSEFCRVAKSLARHPSSAPPYPSRRVVRGVRQARPIKRDLDSPSAMPRTPSFSVTSLEGKDTLAD